MVNESRLEFSTHFVLRLVANRADDTTSRDLVAPLNHQETAVCVTAERAYLARLDGSCRTPIAGFGELRDGGFRFRGEILSTDGQNCLRAERSGAPVT